jgi:hypothetical protein
MTATSTSSPWGLAASSTRRPIDGYANDRVLLPPHGGVGALG